MIDMVTIILISTFVCIAGDRDGGLLAAVPAGQRHGATSERLGRRQIGGSGPEH